MLQAIERTFGVELEFINDSAIALSAPINSQCGVGTVEVEA